MTLPARRGRDAGAPYWAAARGCGTEKGRGSTGCAWGAGFCAPDVKTRHPGAECVLRLRNGLERGKRLSGINSERHSKALRAGKVRGSAS